MNEQEFWAPLQPTEAKPILYRLYYDDQGSPLFYSQEDLPGNYIELTQKMFHEQPKHIRVVNGKLEILNTTVTRKLKPGTHGTPCHPDDISIVVSSTEPNKIWSMR